MTKSVRRIFVKPIVSELIKIAFNEIAYEETFSADLISHLTGRYGADEGTECQQRTDPRAFFWRDGRPRAEHG